MKTAGKILKESPLRWNYMHDPSKSNIYTLMCVYNNVHAYHKSIEKFQ